MIDPVVLTVVVAGVVVVVATALLALQDRRDHRYHQPINELKDALPILVTRMK